MAEQSAAAQTGSDHRSEIQLNVISPSPEISKLTFPNLATSCTIRELKEKIRDVTPTKLETSKQRLIYRGKVLQNEGRTLQDVFGQDTIDSSNEPITIHLITPSPNTQHAASSSAPQPLPPRQPSPNPTRTTPETTTNPPSVPANQALDPSPAQGAPRQTNPQAQGPHVHTHINVPQGQFPPQLQHTMAHIHAVNQQMAAHLASLPGMAPGGLAQMGQLGPNPPQMPQMPQIPPTRMRVDFQQPHPGTNPAQAQRPPTPQPNFPGMPVHVRVPAGQPLSNAGAFRPGSAPPASAANTHTVMREHVGPNGQRWQTVVQGGFAQVNPAFLAPPNAPGLPPGSTNTMPRSHSSPGPATGNPQSNRVRTNPTNSANPVTSNHQQAMPPNVMRAPNFLLQSLLHHFSTMETSIEHGVSPEPYLIQTASNLMHTVAPFISIDEYHALLTRYSAIVSHATSIRNNSDRQLQHFAEAAGTAQRAANTETQSMMFILSSPNGPQALLMSPSGTYTTPWPVTTSTPANTGGLINQQGPLVPQLQDVPAPANALANPDGVNNAQPLLDDQVRLAQNQAALLRIRERVQDMRNIQQQQQQEQGAQPNQPRDIVRIMIPLGSHLWLLIRLFGFVYFFTHGQSWRRTILLSLAALFLFLAQTGAFRPFVTHIWDPIRRHAEALLPLAADEQPRGGERRPPNNDPTAAATANSQEPTPQQAAERLLEERRQQDGNIIRQGLRRAERAIALFIASLVPGVGERHIAAREAAEAARQAQVREEEERLNREEEARAQEGERRENEGEQDALNSEMAPGQGGSTGSGHGQSATQHESGDQPPLIEI